MQAPLLDAIENITYPSQLRALRSWFGGPAATFKIYLDDAAGLPAADWKTTWDKPRQWGLAGNKNWATKYGAQGFIPHMVAHSPFLTTDWQQATAIIAVCFPRQFAGGPAIVQQQCLQRLRARSPAFQATNGSKHFFIFTDSRGPCCLDGKYKDTEFLNHHIIGPHGEPSEGWFFRRGKGPHIRCFDGSKDVIIPTPNIHFPRTPYAPTLQPVAHRRSDERPLLLFYAGWNYKVRMELVEMFKTDADMVVRKEVPPAKYIEHIRTAKFCPVCGGFSQWTPRLAEALYYECVPIIMSQHMLEPFSHLLDWSSFSARLAPRDLPTLKSFVRSLDHARLLRGVRAARATLMYELGGRADAGADMLPLLVYAMSQVLAKPIVRPPGVLQLYNDIDTEHDYDQDVPNVASQKAHGVRATAGVQVDGEAWDCKSNDGYMCSCKRRGGGPKGPKKKGKAALAAAAAAVAGGSDTYMHGGPGSDLLDRFGRGGRGKRGGGGRSGGGKDFGGRRRLVGDAAAAAATATAGVIVQPPPEGLLAKAEADAAALTCPLEADLEQPSRFDAMLRARASAAGDIVITILGPTTGERAIKMGKLGRLMLANMVANLKRVGVAHYLAITTHLHLPGNADNNLCLSELRPAGLCCAWAGVGMPRVAEGTVGRSWTVSETHPYLLFLQRWWFTSQATARGYNVLSLDTDMHLDLDPLAMMRGARYAGFSAMLQLDSGWPAEGRREGQKSTDDRGQHENVVPCRAAAAAGAPQPPQGCPCGVAPMPLLNTGFVWVRGVARARGGDPAAPQSMLFNRSVENILSRLLQAPAVDERCAAKCSGGAVATKRVRAACDAKCVDPHTVWAQDTVNEAADGLAELPGGWPARCHQKDTGCRALASLGPQDRKDHKRRWWLARRPRTTSAWLAALPVTGGGGGAGAGGATATCGAARAGLEKNMVAWTTLQVPSGGASAARTTTATTTGGGPATLGALPRSSVGRLCGARVAVPPSLLRRAPPLPTGAFAPGGEAWLRQSVLHMQFTKAETRMEILEALGWWYAATPARQPAPAAVHTTCAALASGAAAAAAGVDAAVQGVVVSAALANFSLLCLLPGPRDGQAAVVDAEALPRGLLGNAPCCWRLDALRMAAEAAGAALADAEATALRRARRWTACRLWRRFA